MDLTFKLAQERRGRLAAERLLELKQAELFAANKKLGDHALALTNEIAETRNEVKEVRSQAEALKGENVQVKSDLRIAEQRLWDSIQTIPDGFAVFDKDDRLVTANDAFISIFDGLEEAKSGINYGRALELLVEEGAIDVGDQPAAEWQAEMLERWANDFLEPRTIKLWNGRYVKLLDRRAPNGDTVSLTLDITETIRYEEKLKEARENAEAAARTKSSFLANMSHEIRTPMNGVVGMADLLLDQTLNDDQRLYAETIKSSGEALLVIINDVLDYSKIEAKKLELHPESFDLEAAVFEVHTLLLPEARQKGLEMFLDVDMGLGKSFIGDPGRIRQVLINLLGNAIKFTKAGHIIIRVIAHPAVAQTPDMVEVVVEDTGIGIEEGQIDHVFGEFNQADDAQSRQFDGTGLGLAITKQLVELMGGQIWAQSTLGEGSTFGFKIPLECEQAMPNGLSFQQTYPRGVIVGPDTVGAETLLKTLAGLGIEAAQRPHIDATPYDLVIYHDAAPTLSDDLDIIKQHNPNALVIVPAVDGAEQRDGNPRVQPLSLPATRDQFLAALTPLSPEKPILSEPQTPRKMRILAAEDNKTNRLVFSKMVQDLLIDLEFANNGIEAVAKFKEFKPDMVFMDISMPEMDGKEATRTIRAFETETAAERTPIVALTAHAMAGDADDILKAGLDHYLTKPLRKQTICDVIENHCPDACLAPMGEVKLDMVSE